MGALKWLLGLGVVVIWNHREPKRIAKSIVNGGQSSGRNPCDEESIKFCPDFLENEIKRRLDDCEYRRYLFGIIGPSGSGKSFALHALEQKLENTVHFSLDPTDYERTKSIKESGTDLEKAILAKMREKIFTLPGFLSQIKLTNHSADLILEKAFKKVEKDTDVPVTLLIDLNMRNPNDKFNCENLTRHLKSLVSDSQIMNCVFAASRGSLFQSEALREPALNLFYTKELPLDVSIPFLKYVNNALADSEIDASDLSHIPRTFVNLSVYAQLSSKERNEFVDKVMRSNKNIIQNLSPNQRKLLLLASSLPDVGYSEYSSCQLNENDMQEMVNLEILSPTRSGKYNIQFDCWKSIL